MSILDGLGVNLATKFRHTHWVSLRELIHAIREEWDNDTTTVSSGTEMIEQQFILDVLDLFSREDIPDSLFWRCDEEYAPITFWVKCSDTFCWGCADSEDLTPETLPILKQAIEDCKRIDPLLGSIYACDLFAARMRGMRPQGAAYPKNKDLWPLFDACGPERETGLGNPYKPGEKR